MVGFTVFKDSLAGDAPAAGLTPVLAGLWWLAKGDWDRAHRIVQDETGRDAAWVHAHLHRVEGDLGNAAYWYRQAGQPVATDALDIEFERIVSALMGSSEP
ncbi:hypothetical protein ACQR16_15560 [Bradyrhizobium oligotrophicum]|uniref:hypothetical protein n=1 Tax=Bradyrhizobium oligotrophicum TaxID=44255 RepID=UPI003EB8A765